MVSFIVGGIVTLVTFYISLIYSSESIGLLGFAEAVLLVLAFLFLLWRKRKICAEILSPMTVAEAGDFVPIVLRVNNQSGIVCTRVQYQLICGNRFFGAQDKSRKLGEAIYPGDNEFECSVQVPYAGNYEFELRSIRIYDLTGLFYMTKRIGRSTQIQVLPQITSVGIRISERTRNFYGDADVYDDFHPGDDRSEIFDIREFQAGDRIQSIHWKLSAKSDELLVRQDSQALACPVVLLLDQYAAGAKTQEEVEHYLEAVTSISFTLMDVACPHFIAWYSGERGDIVRIRVDNEESFYIFVCEYFADCLGKAPLALKQLYTQKYREDHALFHIQVVDRKLLLNEHELAAMHGHKWKEIAEELEIVL